MVGTTKVWGQNGRLPIVQVEYFGYSSWSIFRAPKGWLLSGPGDEEPKLEGANRRLGTIRHP